jgi:serine phosphatase RsbU (regulator of sigma subunit)/anti-sigma regulatory factor (Ser/Thr protein kinase)
VGSPQDWPFDPSTELGRDYLAVDWAGTELGPLEGWSDSLRSTVQLMLSSQFSMWMGWGPQLTFFCNDAYRRDTLADKYPWALGRPAREVWSEVWDDVADRVDAVTVAGQSTWDEELQLYVQRRGYIEETYHTFSYSPVTEGDSSIAGLLCVVSEVTEGVINARRITSLSDLSAGLAAAATERDVYAAAQARVGLNPTDFPFAAAYVIEADGTSARLAWSCGLPPGRPATPEVVGLGAARNPWPLDPSSAEVQVVDIADELLGDVAPSPYGVRPDRAAVAPISQPVTGTLGFLVVGASPHRALDEHYLGFIQLAAEQFGAALTRARALEIERDQAVLVAARERAIARDLQASLLPAEDFDTDHLDIATYYRAGAEGTDVGGDWYDVIDLGPGRTALVIGDVMGRGVQAAAVMGQLRAAVRAYARLELAPNVVLGLLDETVRELAGDRIATCVYAVYDPAEQTLTYANAGHPPPLLTRPGDPARSLPGVGAPLGAGRSWPTVQTVTLAVGATLTLYTDGLVERRESDIDQGIARVMDVLESSTAPVDTVPDHLVTQLVPTLPDDDVALLVARVSQRARLDHIARLPLERDARNVSIAREFITTNLHDWQVDDDTAFDAELVVSELVTNAFVHAQTEAMLTIRSTGARLFLEVHDHIATAPRPRNALPEDTNGRGLAIVATLATRWGTRQTSDGKAVWCELSLAAAEARHAS